MNNKELKKCMDCNKDYPATEEFFYKNGKKLQVRCKKCHVIKRQNNRKKEKENVNKSTIVLTENEVKSFSKKAEEFHISRADLIKLMILKAENEPLIKVDPKCFTELNRQIIGIATNVNQIARLCNTVGTVNQKDIEELREEFRKVIEWVSELSEEWEMIDSSIKYAKKIIDFDDI